MMTENRFYELFIPNYKSKFEISARINEEWMVSMDVSPYSGAFRFTTSFYKYFVDKEIPSRSGNKLMFRSKNYDDVKKFYLGIKESK